MSSIDLAEFEPSKENLRPLKTGVSTQTLSKTSRPRRALAVQRDELAEKEGCDFTLQLTLHKLTVQTIVNLRMN